MLIDETYLNYIKKQAEGVLNLLIQEQGGEDEDNFRFLDKAVDIQTQLISFLNNLSDVNDLEKDRSLQEIAYKAIENYTSVCNKLKEEGASIYEDPRWKMAETAIFVIGEKILEHN